MKLIVRIPLFECASFFLQMAKASTTSAHFRPDKLRAAPFHKVFRNWGSLRLKRYALDLESEHVKEYTLQIRGRQEIRLVFMT